MGAVNNTSNSGDRNKYKTYMTTRGGYKNC